MTRSARRTTSRSVRRSTRTYRYAAAGALPRLRFRTADLSGSRILALLIFWAMVALLVWFFVDERFFVYEAQIQGNLLVSKGEVYSASGVHTMSIFYLDPRQVARNLQRQFPAVAEARVRCELPGLVRIVLQERRAAFLWQTAGATFIVDAEGHVLKADDGTHADLVVIRDLDDEARKPGDRVPPAALKAVSGLNALLPDVRLFECSKSKGISFTDARGWRVFFGDEQDLPLKVATFQTLAEKLLRERRRITMIDVRFPSSPCYQ